MKKLSAVVKIKPGCYPISHGGTWIRGFSRNIGHTRIRGFSRNIGHTTSVMAEFWALHDGLTLAYQMGLPCLEVELDAK